MIQDVQTLLSNAQAITGDVVSTNVIDLNAPGTIYGTTAAMIRNIGNGHKIPLMVQVVESFNNLTSLEVLMYVDDNAAMSSPKIIGRTGAIPLASLVAGYQFDLDEIGRRADERYFALYYDVTGTAPTLGKITAGVVGGVPSNG